MKVKRYIADDMSTALREVREELGADAVILSSQQLEDRVEILAAKDYDVNLINQALDQNRASSRKESAADYFERAAADREASQRVASLHKDRQEAQLETPTPEQSVAEAPAAPHQAAGLYQPPPENPEFSAMRNEIKSLKALIESRHTLDDWNQLTRQHPLRISLYKKLTELGLSQDVCKYLAKGLEDHDNIDEALQAALKQLLHQIPVADDDLLNQGGIYAMVGPTGVGKTTTIAKLAARFAMRHGQRHVAMISTDNYRIGAQEQLVTYGRLLGVPVYTANTAEELQQQLQRLYDKKLILIDTAGMSQRDLRLSEQLAGLGVKGTIVQTYLVLAANAQLATLNDVILSFRKANLAGCMLTKLDEAGSLGGIISALIRHHLPMAYVSQGQRVPEDLQPARASELVKLMIEYANRHKETTDDAFMAVAFSAGLDHAHL